MYRAKASLLAVACLAILACLQPAYAERIDATTDMVDHGNGTRTYTAGLAPWMHNGTHWNEWTYEQNVTTHSVTTAAGTLHLDRGDCTFTLLTPDGTLAVIDSMDVRDAGLPHPTSDAPCVAVWSPAVRVMLAAKSTDDAILHYVFALQDSGDWKTTIQFGNLQTNATATPTFHQTITVPDTAHLLGEAGTAENRTAILEREIEALGLHGFHYLLGDAHAHIESVTIGEPDADGLVTVELDFTAATPTMQPASVWALDPSYTSVSASLVAYRSLPQTGSSCGANDPDTPSNNRLFRAASTFNGICAGNVFTVTNPVPDTEIITAATVPRQF